MYVSLNGIEFDVSTKVCVPVLGVFFKLNIFPFEIYFFSEPTTSIELAASTGYSFPVCYGPDWKLSGANGPETEASFSLIELESLKRNICWQTAVDGQNY